MTERITPLIKKNKFWFDARIGRIIKLSDYGEMRRPLTVPSFSVFPYSIRFIVCASRTGGSINQ